MVSGLTGEEEKTFISCIQRSAAAQEVSDKPRTQSSSDPKTELNLTVASDPRVPVRSAELLRTFQTLTWRLWYGSLVKVGQWSELSGCDRRNFGSCFSWRWNIYRTFKHWEMTNPAAKTDLKYGKFREGFSWDQPTCNQTVIMGTRKVSHLVELPVLDLAQRVQIILFLHKILISSDISIKLHL